MGERYWVPFGGREGKGTYLEKNKKEDIIAAYKNPADFKLDNVKPIAKVAKLWPKVYYAVSGWVEGTFHVVPKESITGKQYGEREKCTGHGCTYCKESLPKVFGKKVYFIFARTHWDGEIFAWNERINSTCKCGGFIHNPYYKCSACDEVLVDVTQHCWKCKSENVGVDPEEAVAVCQDCEAEWSVYESDNPDIKEKVCLEDFKCPHCGHEDFPVPVQECSDCKEPDSYGIFDCQMEISAIKTKDGKSTDLHIAGVKIREPDERLFSSDNQGGRNADAIAKIKGKDSHDADADAEWMKKPYDLDKIFSPPTAEEQASLIKVENPFRAGTDAGYKHYSKNSSTEPEDTSSEPEEVSQEPEETVVRNPPSRRVGKFLRK